MKKKQAPISRKEWLALRPWRNPALNWYEDEDRVVLHIKRQQSWKTKFLNLFIPLPAERKIALDAIGTHVWRLLDGQTTVGTIARSVAKEYKLVEREAELSVQQFFRELVRRGYVGFSDVEASGKSAKKASPTKADKTDKAAPGEKKTDETSDTTSKQVKSVQPVKPVRKASKKRTKSK